MARRSGDNMAYGDFPERWDRSRFERIGGGSGPPQRYHEDYSYREQDRPGRRDVMVQDRIDERGPRGRYEETDRYFEEDRYAPGRQRRRRTDKELFGDVDPREFANMALTPYQPQPQQRPGMIRRQSSLDTFDRRPIPVYEREERRIPVYKPVPVPYEQERYSREVDFEETRGRDYYQPQSYREVEIRREKSVGPYPPPPKSVKRAKSSKSKKSKSRYESSSSDSSDTEKGSVHPSRHGGQSNKGGQSVHESYHESQHWPGGGESFDEHYDESQHGGHQSEHYSEHESYHQGNQSVSESIHETTKNFKKGKTRMPKRLVRREAIQDLGYPFDEEEHFFVLTIALEKEQIDEVIKISETYWNGEKKTVFKFDETINIPQIVEPQNKHEEVIRTEWINPPSVAGSHHRSHSHSGGYRNRRDSSRSRRTSRAKEDYYEEVDVTKNRSIVVEDRRAPEPPAPPVYEVERKTVYKETDETLSPTRSRGALVVRRDPEYRSNREINDEIARLEAEGRALRLERDAETKRELVVRERRDDYEEVDFYGRPSREVVEFVDRDRIVDREPKNVTRVEKDRKERERRRILALAAKTLT